MSESIPLCDRKCEACKRGGDGSVPMSREEVSKHMPSLCPSWQLSPEGDKISRTFNAKNFASAIDFINKIAALAEEEGHHPDLSVSNWNTVSVVMWTHTIKGLDINDLIVAAKSDLIPVVYSPKWLRENPHVTAGVAAAEK
eukprot:CAMPEP_0173428948 /NCGR_PEP_ID=MMETSP1357-20121228/7795_1 /TAXON_ID=77926 /ORGANISM="Hemiselmis rufescens, Strain PCC563" /LENGTH=140 /DNA_ID=CAMNT_0014393051 /DNA_START=22 /DNA_END=444 /DNA_ORIENTATION=-